MLEKRLELYVEQLDVDKKLKQFIKEILILESDRRDEIFKYTKIYEDKIDKCIRDD
nr:hypothetical protein [uncultured Methanobrevibacter sp.]